MLPLSGWLYITSGWTTIRELARPLNTCAFYGINPMAEPITSKLPATRPAPSLMKSECSSSCGRASLPASRADPDASGLSKCLYLNPGLQRANQKQLQDLDFSTEFESQSLTTASISYSACSTVSLGQFLPRLEPVFKVSYPNTPPCSWCISRARRRISSIFNPSMAAGLAPGISRVSD